jgi:hypothetical protein
MLEKAPTAIPWPQGLGSRGDGYRQSRNLAVRLERDMNCSTGKRGVFEIPGLFLAQDPGESCCPSTVLRTRELGRTKLVRPVGSPTVSGPTMSRRAERTSGTILPKGAAREPHPVGGPDLRRAGRSFAAPADGIEFIQEKCS